MALPMELAPALFGMGVAETPEVTTLPWNIGAKPTAAEAKEARTEERLSQANMFIGLAGGAVGLLLALPALKKTFPNLFRK